MTPHTKLQYKNATAPRRMKRKQVILSVIRESRLLARPGNGAGGVWLPFSLVRVLYFMPGEIFTISVSLAYASAYDRESQRVEEV
jgi:hypothetical protein